MRPSFHVDDLLYSADNVEQATTIVRRALRKCAAGEFHSTEIASSGRQVIDALSLKAGATNIKNADLLQALCPIEQALGVYWSIVNHAIEFKIDLKDERFTENDILAIIGSISDPLSLVATFSILQDLRNMKMEWDDEISDDIRTL